MTKQEKIQEVYGRFYGNAKKHIRNDGSLSEDIWNALAIDIEYDDYSTGYFRPKSLQGIENNNGWIKIESEDDLPNKGMTNYFICIDGNPSIHVYNLRQLISMKDFGISHYQPIEIKQPPLH